MPQNATINKSYKQVILIYVVFICYKYFLLQKLKYIRIIYLQLC